MVLRVVALRGAGDRLRQLGRLGGERGALRLEPGPLRRQLLQPRGLRGQPAHFLVEPVALQAERRELGGLGLELLDLLAVVLPVVLDLLRADGEFGEHMLVLRTQWPLADRAVALGPRGLESAALLPEIFVLVQEVLPLGRGVLLLPHPCGAPLLERLGDPIEFRLGLEPGRRGARRFVGRRELREPRGDSLELVAQLGPPGLEAPPPTRRLPLGVERLPLGAQRGEGGDRGEQFAEPGPGLDRLGQLQVDPVEVALHRFRAVLRHLEVTFERDDLLLEILPPLGFGPERREGGRRGVVRGREPGGGLLRRAEPAGRQLFVRGELARVGELGLPGQEGGLGELPALPEPLLGHAEPLVS